jgi:hypothetical protein
MEHEGKKEAQKWVWMNEEDSVYCRDSEIKVDFQPDE